MIIVMMTLMMMVMIEEDKGNDTLCERHIQALPVFFSSYVNKSEETYPGEPTVWKTFGYLEGIKIFGCAIVCIGGLLGNISVILAVAFNKSSRTTINFYIANLAVVDAIICIFCVGPLALLVMTNRVYILGQFMCKSESFIKYTCLTNSIITLTAISCDRFLAVMHPLRVRISNQRSHVLVIIWIVSIVVAIPQIPVNKYRVVQWKNYLETDCSKDYRYEWYYDESGKECIARISQFYTIYGIILSSVSILPILIMSTAYSFILQKVWTTETPGEQIAANIKADARVRRKVNKMVFIVLMVYIVCWIPSQATILYVLVRMKMTPKDVFRSSKVLPDPIWFSMLMTYSNSFMNPIIYAGLNQDLRQGMWSILRCVSLKDRRRKPDVILRPSRNMPKKMEGARKPEPQKPNVKMGLKYTGAEGALPPQKGSIFYIKCAKEREAFTYHI